MKRIYLDHSATTPLDKKVLAEMMPYFKNNFGNASSLHHFGQEAMKGIDWAREQLSHFFNCQPKEIVFTSGASEADNLAIRGIIRYCNLKFSDKKFHIITSAFEHPAVLEVCQALERENLAEVTYVKPKTNGLIAVEDIKKAIKENTILVSIMYVNNEIGTIQPIAEIGEMIQQLNSSRDKNNIIFFHTDAVQASLYCPMDVNKLKVDLASISAHKIYGPKGVGALYVREKTPLKAIMFGGHQENGVRPGTYNTAGIVGLGAAVELINNGTRAKENKKIKILRDKLIAGLTKKIKNTLINGDLKHRVEANANISFLNAEGESILLMLDMAGIAVSTGSACASGSLEPSHVLLSLGRKHEECHAAIRFTLGKDNTLAEINQVIKVLPPIIERLRKMSPMK